MRIVYSLSADPYTTKTTALGGAHTSFVSKRLDRIQARGLAGGVEEDAADTGGEAERERDRLGCHERPPLGEVADQLGAPPPSAMPMVPPITESVTASIRNWSMMWRRRAPTAMRRPISRVRSVTDTSMMFMIPMPPTSRETEAIAASK